MKSETRTRRGISGTAVVVAGLIASAALAADARAQSNVTRNASGSVSVDLSVLDGLGAPRTVPQVLQPSVRSLLMPNSSAARDSRLQQLVPPQAPRRGTAMNRPRAPAAPARPAARPAAPPTMMAPAEPPAPPTPPASTARPAGDPAPARRAPTRITPPPPPEMTPAPPAPPAMAAAPPAPPEPPAPPAPAPSAPPAAAAPPPPAPPAPAITSAPPPPPPEMAKEPAATERQTAALPPPATGGLAPGKQFRLIFDTGDATMRNASQQTLDEVSEALKSDDSLRLQLLAYAGGSAQTASQARRLSLSRALAVRSYLIEKGVRSTRIDVRALGNKSESGPSDRVDVIVTTR